MDYAYSINYFLTAFHLFLSKSPSTLLWYTRRPLWLVLTSFNQKLAPSDRGRDRASLSSQRREAEVGTCGFMGWALTHSHSAVQRLLRKWEARSSDIRLLCSLRLFLPQCPLPSPACGLRGSVIPWGSPMTIFCRIPPGVNTSRLQGRRHSGLWCDREPHRALRVVESFHQNVTHLSAGLHAVCARSKESGQD